MIPDFRWKILLSSTKRVPSAESGKKESARSIPFLSFQLVLLVAPCGNRMERGLFLYSPRETRPRKPNDEVENQSLKEEENEICCFSSAPGNRWTIFFRRFAVGKAIKRLSSRLSDEFNEPLCLDFRNLTVTISTEVKWLVQPPLNVEEQRPTFWIVSSSWINFNLSQKKNNSKKSLKI